MLDFLTLEEAQSAINTIGHRRVEKRVLKHPRLRVRAVEQRDLRQAHAVVGQRLDLVNDKTGLVDISIGLVNP